MANKYLDESGLAFYDGKIKERLGKKADATSVPTKVSQLQNDSGYITGADVPEGAAASNTPPKMDGTANVGTETAFARGDHVHPTDTSRLSTSGDGSQVTISFNTAANREELTSGETLATIIGKIAKNYADLGALAYKTGISSDDLDATIKASLAKADSALQSYTETDPTVPAWAKEATKPTYTAAEIGAIPSSQADTFAKKSDLTSVYKYKGSVDTYTDLPAENNTVGDVYNVEASGMNYAWTGESWDALGEVMSIESITNDEIDIIVGSE